MPFIIAYILNMSMNFEGMQDFCPIYECDFHMEVHKTQFALITELSFTSMKTQLTFLFIVFMLNCRNPLLKNVKAEGTAQHEIFDHQPLRNARAVRRSVKWKTD